LQPIDRVAVGRHGPVPGDDDLAGLGRQADRSALPQHGQAAAVDQCAAGVALEDAVARADRPVVRLQDEEAVARQGQVERLAGRLERAGAEVGVAVIDARAGLASPGRPSPARVRARSNVSETRPRVR
jgi:hypothetical protein